MTEPAGPRKVIFIGGAPHAGIAAARALLCTAPACNAPEGATGFLRPLFEAYAVGLAERAQDTAGLFAGPEELKQHIRALVRPAMWHVWQGLQCPMVLCLGDPGLSRLFPEVQLVLDWPCQFVTVLRHPHDVLRARQQACRRAGQPMTALQAYEMAQTYLQSYRHLDAPELAERVIQLRYEDLDEGWLIEQLRGFTGMGSIERPRGRALGGRARPAPLAADLAGVVNAVCGPMMARCGYHPDGGHDIW